MDNKKVGQFISEARKKKGLTQKELADKLFITDKAISKWERGISLPDTAILNKLSEVLEMDLNKLLNPEELQHSVSDIIDEKELRKLIKSNPKRYYRIYKSYFIIFLVIDFFVSTSVYNSYGFSRGVVTFIVLFLIFYIFFFFGKETMLLETILKREKIKKPFEINNKYSFYNTYFTFESKNTVIDIKYSEVRNLIETDTNYYIETDKNSFIIKKNECDLETVMFIRNIFKDVVDNRLGKEEYITLKDNTSIKRFIKNRDKLLFILFILTIVVYLVSGYLVDYIIRVNHLYFDSYYKAYIYNLIFLPISILSFVLGIKFYKRGYKCVKNIVAGILVSIFLILPLINVSIINNYHHNSKYSELDKYKENINITLPSYGGLIDMTPKDSKYNIERDYIIYYTNEDTSYLDSQISTNDNWISYNDIKELDIPKSLTYTDACLFNKTSNEYNIVPNSEGEYEMYLMLYHKQAKTFELVVYKYKVS